jgi:hypothetical protein
MLANTVTADPDDVLPGAGVEDPGHVDPGLDQVRDGRVAVGVGGQHDRPLARLDRVQPDEPAHRGRQHTPGTSLPAKT